MTMLGAMGLHIQRKQYDAIKKNVPLLLLALFVAVGRLIIIPIS
ncbi:MAG TPA: DoxX family protein, partial [Balneola sp.]|nr:DoxX family protein [Balneola sp.]